MKYLIALFCIGSILGCSSSPNYKSATTDIIFEADKTPIVKVTPIYPWDALRQGMEGEVKLQFIVGESNKPVKIEIVQGIGEPLDSAAVRALEKAFYHPRNIGEKLVAIAKFTLNKPI